jgi:hypothetical protein
MNEIFPKPTIEITVEQLQQWALYLSQNDRSPRWEIEQILKDHNYPTRERFA